jgi:ABC-2 type transport system ATP-binding protein
VRFGSQRVLHALDWRLMPATVVGLLGRNGAGKTTLIETLLGLREADAGEALLFGRTARAIDDDVRSRIGYVPQRADLFEWFTPAQMLDYFRSFYPRWNAPKVDDLMSRWEIERNKPIAHLSVGQKQRLSIIRALAHDPALLVLDEPVASLDAAARREFLRELVDQVAERGTTVLFSTHILTDLQRVVADVAFLVDGHIGLQGSLDDLLEDCARLVGAPRAVQSLLRSSGWLPLGRGDGGGLVVRGVAAAGGPAPVVDVDVEPVTLEDLFIAVTDPVAPDRSPVREPAGAA